MSAEFCEYVIEVLSPFGKATAKKMFGGYSIYLNGLIICIIANDELYFKANKARYSQFKNAGGIQFVYYKNSKPYHLQYFKFSNDVLEDEVQLKKWLDISYTISKDSKK